MMLTCFCAQGNTITRAFAVPWLILGEDSKSHLFGATLCWHFFLPCYWSILAARFPFYLAPNGKKNADRQSQAESGRGMFIFCQGGSTFSITIDFVAGTEDGPVPVRAQCRSHASFWSKVKVGQEATPWERQLILLNFPQLCPM